MVFHTHSAAETEALGERLGRLLRPGDVVAMTGTLAAGKTTLTKGIARALGVTEVVTSPTFCLISEYEGSVMPLFHMDVYRLDGAEDFEGTGAGDLLYGTGVSVVEWSEKVASALPESAIGLAITPLPDGSREITLTNWRNGSIA